MSRQNIINDIKKLEEEKDRLYDRISELAFQVDHLELLLVDYDRQDDIEHLNKICL